jgi:hypothetical protein
MGRLLRSQSTRAVRLASIDAVWSRRMWRRAWLWVTRFRLSGLPATWCRLAAPLKEPPNHLRYAKSAPVGRATKDPTEGGKLAGVTAFPNSGPFSQLCEAPRGHCAMSGAGRPRPNAEHEKLCPSTSASPLPLPPTHGRNTMASITRALLEGLTARSRGASTTQPASAMFAECPWHPSPRSKFAWQFARDTLPGC